MSSLFRLLTVFVLSGLILSACTSTGQVNWPNHNNPFPPLAEGQTPDITATTPITTTLPIALLVPLSGTHSDIGQAVLQAGQLALDDLNEKNIDLQTYDTQLGANVAMQNALKSNPKIIIGPIFSNDVAAVRPLVSGGITPVITLTTDWRQTGGNVMTIGILPFDQAEQMATFAVKKLAKRNILMLRIDDAYGQAVGGSFSKITQANGAKVTDIILPVNFTITQLQTRIQASALQSIDAVFVPLSGPALTTALSALKTVPNLQNTTLLGTGLWDDTATLAQPSLENAYFAAPAPEARLRFEQSYLKTFGEMPPRIASLGYDAVAMTVMLARTPSKSGTENLLSTARLTNPNGFIGIDGLFRFYTDGKNQRGLAIHQVKNKRAVTVQSAPNMFTN